MRAVNSCDSMGGCYTDRCHALQIAKSPAAPTASFPYQITAAGLELAPQEQGHEGREMTGNVLAQGIRHDVDYQPPQ